MQRLIVGAVVLVALAAAVAWQSTPTAQFAEPRPPATPWLSYIVNWPETQDVSGTVSVDNLPAVQAVEIVNWPQPAGTARFQLVGFTTTTMNGGSGVFTFTAACQAEFPGSRMCTITEATRITEIPDLSNGTYLAWADTDEPGFSSTESCGGWGATYQGWTGTAISELGRRHFVLCEESWSVACCAPVE